MHLGVGDKISDVFNGHATPEGLIWLLVLIFVPLILLIVGGHFLRRRVCPPKRKVPVNRRTLTTVDNLARVLKARGVTRRTSADVKSAGQRRASP